MASYTVTPDQGPIWEYFKQVVPSIHKFPSRGGIDRLPQLSRWRCPRLGNSDELYADGRLRGALTVRYKFPGCYDHRVPMIL